MKDIYSPLEIDEEWDQRAPDMGGNEGGGTSVAVAPTPDSTTGIDTSTESNMGASTLPPEQTAEEPAAVDSMPMAGDTVEPSGDMMHDPAHDAAEAAVAQPVPVGVEGDAPAPSSPVDTLDISDMSSGTEPSGDMPGADAEQPDTDEKTDEPAAADADIAEPTKINVMGDSGAEEPAANGLEAGSVVEPQVKPDGAEDVMPEPEAVEPGPKEDEEPELPSSPVVEEEVKDEPVHEEDEGAPEDMDSTDKRFMAAIDEYNKAKQRAHERLAGLMGDVESDIDKTRTEIADLEAHVDAKEKEREEIQTQLDELGEVA